MSTRPQDCLYYLDANALCKFYRDEQGDLDLRRLVARSPSQVLLSPLTVIEFVSVLMAYYRKGLLKRKQVHAIARRLRRDSAVGKTNRPFRVIPVPEGAFREAEGILLQYAGTYSFASNDALHLAIVIRQDAADPVVLVTSDRALKHVAWQRSVTCYDPELG